MECKDCDKNGECEYQLYTTTAMERANGEYHFIKGRNCPKDWQDKKVEDMTDEQLREAVKELREKLLTENKSAEEIMAQTELENPSKEYKEAMDRLTAYEPIYDEPPLGCKPAQLVCTDRIKIVADAISRYADSPKFNSQLVRRWATEIELQCDIFERC